MIETLKNPTAAADTTTAYLEQNGKLVLEAEKGEKTAGESHTWEAGSGVSGASKKYLTALPDIGTRYKKNQLENSPALDFDINISDSGRYTMWVRGYATDKKADSLYASLGSAGNTTPTPQPLTGFTVGEWSWVKATNRTSLSGLHTLTLHMQEDGFNIDKVMLSKDQAFVPSGKGANASPSGPVQDDGTQNNHIVYTYDDLYRLTKAVYTGDVSASYGYSYDEVGNMVGFTQKVAGVRERHQRTFNALNQMVTDEQIGVGSKTISYDSNGNMLQVKPEAGSAEPIQSYRYNQRNLMTAACEGNCKRSNFTATFMYDGNNDRLRQTAWDSGSKTGITSYTNDTIGLTQMLVSDGGAGNVVYHLYGNSHLGQQVQGSSQFQTFITDGLGSVRVEMETSGRTNYVRTFSPFGETLKEDGTRNTVFGYTGQQEDASTGLIYLRARYYSAELKAFTAYDLWDGVNSRPSSLNHYAYVEGNPANLIDPTGKYGCGPNGYLDCEDNAFEEQKDLIAQYIKFRDYFRPSLSSYIGGELPDYSAWLTNVMVSNAKSAPVTLMKDLKNYGLVLSEERFDMWKAYVGYKEPWDFKPWFEKKLPQPLNRPQVLMIGQTQIPYDTLGNIHYGYVGRAAGFAGEVLKLGAGWAQWKNGTDGRFVTYADSPEDYLAVSIGIDLYNQYGANLTENDLIQKLAPYGEGGVSEGLLFTGPANELIDNIIDSFCFGNAVFP